MGMFDFLKTILETREMHSITSLRTHYYKKNYKIVKQAVLDYASSNKLDVQNVDDKHGELYFQAKNFHIIASIVQVTPVETAVDFKVQYYSLIGWNRPLKDIKKFYAYLDQTLPFKGTSLHP
ncbi:MAG: hypothetical protein K9L26_04140 [Candidatus Izimaplasma sp.]|nr:hypothetical protein [Candidatus Izimaplasma bacterium]